jgi:hypothetical protein
MGKLVGGRHVMQSCVSVHDVSHILLTRVEKGRSDRSTSVSFWWKRTWCRRIGNWREVWSDWISRITSLFLVR